MIKELNEFSNSKHLEFEKILKMKSSMSDDEIECFMHALVDISTAISDIYSDIIPSIMEDKNIDNESFDKLLTELKSQFGHIQYHISDGKLSDFDYSNM